MFKIKIVDGKSGFSAVPRSEVKGGEVFTHNKAGSGPYWIALDEFSNSFYCLDAKDGSVTYTSPRDCPCYVVGKAEIIVTLSV